MDISLTDHTFAPEAESYVIGALLKDPYKVINMMEIAGCEKNWFQQPNMFRIYETAMLLRTAGQPVEVDTIINSLKQQNLWALVGTQCIHSTQVSCKSVHNATAYMQILKDRFVKRRMLEQFELFTDTINSGVTGMECLSAIRFAFANIDKGVATKKTIKSITDSVEAKYKNSQFTKSVGIASRWGSLQEVLSGYVPSKLSFVASRPGQGKTTMGCNELLGCIKRRDVVPCGIISMEMTEEEIREKLAADDLDIDLKKFRGGKATNAEIIELSNKIEEHSHEPVFISEGNKTIDKACIALRDMASDGCRFVVVDYIQRFQTGRGDSKSERERYSNYSNELCNIANETGMHIMVLCQLRRESEFDMHSKRILPRMEHLKGCGEFEQDGHQVILIGREISLQGDTEMSDNQPMTVKVVKNRNGGLCMSPGLQFIFAKSRQKLMPAEMFTQDKEEF